MRRTLRLLASVKPLRYLEAGTPTGLTGLRTHASPRATLLYLYSSTLDKLQAAPEHSVYRQSVEALTKHRMSIVESIVPEGYPAWQQKAAQLLQDHPELSQAARNSDGSHRMTVDIGGKKFIISHSPRQKDMRLREWDGERNIGPLLLGARSKEEILAHFPGSTFEPVTAAEPKADAGHNVKESTEERESKIQGLQADEASEDIPWVPEPKLTADQVSELEHKIGAGLIEEVISVAEGEFRLVDIMLQAKVWESLEEVPAEGQWVYFERKSS
ncbi:ETC complex I subunit conserved region-domain-containing protein [Apodospora peruviana]|uniref:ETC complex I subunit conserved region-domain-containing protein n=1 Tax=Apodospora peruviana TaxID=516989 RepID=A0AAE0I532_9PEZI|nr:ETC complex I subunit conserved region-domain-containing protein [Apodospora peruviana]